MKIKKSVIDDVLLLEFDIFEDERGFFTRAFCVQEMRKHGVPADMVQANLAGSVHKGTLRGLHFQEAPYGEDKLLRCIRGAIYDVIADIRPESSTYGKWCGFELTENNRQMVFVPKGCAHGYLTLLEDTQVYYLVSEFYTPDAERGIRWNDKAFNIEWPISENLLISDKDKNWPDFNLI